MSRIPSNFRSQGSLDAYLAMHNILGLEGMATRDLVRRLRVRGTMTGVLSSEKIDDADLVARARSSPNIVGRDLVREVVPDKPFTWTEGFTCPFNSQPLPARPARFQVVAVDYGMKWNILRW